MMKKNKEKIDLNTELNSDRLKLILVTHYNYKNRINYLERNNKISDFKLENIKKNIRIIDETIPIINLKLGEKDE